MFIVREMPADWIDSICLKNVHFEENEHTKHTFIQSNVLYKLYLLLLEIRFWKFQKFLKFNLEKKCFRMQFRFPLRISN